MDSQTDSQTDARVVAQGDPPARASGDSPGAGATITVLLPRALVGRAGNRSQVAVAGRTVREVLDSLEADNPGMRFELCHETGELRPFVNVFVNGEHIRYLGGLDAPVRAGATLHILPSVAGG
jgi:molybdopterin synthase sulfur carrier subunit